MTGNVLTVLTALQREFPSWAVWRRGDGEWSATRVPRGGRTGSPGSVLLWVFAHSPEELGARMREEDQAPPASSIG